MIERILGGPLELGLFCIKSISSFVSRISYFVFRLLRRAMHAVFFMAAAFGLDLGGHC